MTYEVSIAGEDTYIFQTLICAYDCYDAADKATLTESGYINGEYHERVIESK